LPWFQAAPPPPWGSRARRSGWAHGKNAALASWPESSKHVTRSSAAPAEDVVGVRTVRALAACQQDAEAEALQLFMLLALTREKRGGCPLTRQDLLGRQLVVLLLSEQRAYHYFGAVAQRNLQAPSHLHR